MITKLRVMTIYLVAFSYTVAAIDSFNDGYLTEQDINDENGLEPHSRERRGWASIILYGVSFLVSTTSLGLTVAAALTEGCSYFPSICKDREAIEDLDKKIKVLKAQYDKMYKHSAIEWVDLRYVSTNNGYINFYVDEVIRHVENLSDYQRLIEDQLKLDVPALFKIYEASQNLTAEKYLETLIGRLDLQLSDITKMLKQQRDITLIGLAAQMMIQTGLNAFVKSYNNAYKQLKVNKEFEAELDKMWTVLTDADEADAEIILDKNNPEYEQVMKKYGLKTSDFTKAEQIKMAPKVVSRMFQNAKEAGSEALGKLSSWERFKGTVKTKMSRISTTLVETKEFFSSSEALKYEVRNFKLGWSTSIMSTLGIIADGITTAIDILQWKKIKDEMANARMEYEAFHDNLTLEIDNLKAEKVNVTEQWNVNIEIFKNVSHAFDEMIEESKNASDFVNKIGIPWSPVPSDNPLMKIDFDAIEKLNLADSQDIVIDFLKENDNNLTLIVDKVRAVYILYSYVRDQTDSNQTITDIQSHMIDIFNSDPSITVRNFGKSLHRKDTVCAVAILHIQLTEYDFYDLIPFRPNCNVSVADFQHYDQMASKKRNQGLMRQLLRNIINGDSDVSLSQIYDSVQNLYLLSKDQAMVDYGKSISEQDVVCVISQEFPSMKSFHYIDLDAFRPSCDAVSPSEFEELKRSAEIRDGLMKNIETNMKTCEALSFCPCLNLMVKSYRASESDIIAAIKELRPTLTKYCGTTGCSCISLVDASVVSK